MPNVGKSHYTSLSELFLGAVFAREPYLKQYITKLSRKNCLRVKDVIEYKEDVFFKTFPTTQKNIEKIKTYFKNMNMSFKV